LTDHLTGLEPAYAEMDPELARGLAALELDLSTSQRRALLDYLALLSRWNRAYNLTAVTRLEEMVARHLLDSLSILPWLGGQRILDSGTGAGLPGVPLAIACPDREFVLVDSNGKKIRFLREVRRALKLENIDPIKARLEEVAVEPDPATITARALAPLGRLVGWHAPWLARGARLLAMKAVLAEKELAEVAPAYNVEIINLEVPGLSARRCLAIITNK